MAIRSRIQHLRTAGKKALAVLLDPDKLDPAGTERICQLIRETRVDFVLVGGSLLTEDRFEQVVQQVKSAVCCPVILFPGSATQVHGAADALLLLSVISGRNPELLIGQHVLAAPRIKALALETLATGYMLVESGVATTALYVSQTTPLPRHKPEIAAATALAGEMLGLQLLYLDGGSGAKFPVPEATIQAVRANTSLPIIVGGGIRSEAEARAAWQAGADIVVIGTAFEEQPELLVELAGAARSSH